MYNPSLREIPRNAPAPILPIQHDSSILAWLESTGRLIPRETVDNLLDEAEAEEITDLMAGEDDYDEDDDLTLDDED